MNVELLRRVEQHILEEPRRLHMEGWYYSIEDREPYSSEPPCGTAACIAGWAQLLEAGWAPGELAYDVVGDDSTAHDRGQEALDLDDAEAEALFYTSNWPEPFWSLYRNAGGKDMDELARQRILAAITVARIEHFILESE